MSTSAKGKKSYADAAVEQFTNKDKKRSRTSSSTETKETNSKFANIEANPFHQIVLQSASTPEEKAEAVAKALAYDESRSKEENAQMLASFEIFKEYLMEQRKEMSKEIIRLSDTEAFSELQSVFQEMNQSLQDFENQITPLMEIIDAVHRLNVESDGAMYDVFKEIQEDKAEEERIAKLREEQEAKVEAYQNDVHNAQRDIAALREQKSWFGMGGTTQKALEEIARKQTDIEQKNRDISELRSEIEATTVDRETKFADFSEEKAKLRELLDLTSDEHKERQENLVRAALNFVNTTDERTGAVLSHMEGIRDQIKNVGTVNGSMRKIFAVVNDGILDAEKQNATLTETFSKAAEGESQLQTFEREDKLEAVNEHVDALNASKVDTLGTYGELQEESLNIKSMRDTNNSQINSTRSMHTKGTAGVASRLSTVLTAVSAAALNEAKATTQNTLKGMNMMTNQLAQNEAIKNATQMHVQNDELAQAIEQLASYKDVSDKATEITRAALEEQKQLQREMQDTADELAKSVKKAKGVTADVMQDASGDFGRAAAGRGSEETATPDAPAKKNPFASLNI
jgi:myosin heavy subunit